MYFLWNGSRRLSYYILIKHYEVFKTNKKACKWNILEKAVSLAISPFEATAIKKTNIQTDIFCSCFTSIFEYPDTSIVFLKWHVKLKKSLKNKPKQNSVPFSCVLCSNFYYIYICIFPIVIYECFWTKESVLCALPKKCVWFGSCEPENSPILRSNKTVFKICRFVDT